MRFILSALLLLVGCNNIPLSSLGEKQADCIFDLYHEDVNSYDYWEAKFKNSFNGFEPYDAGSYCTLENGNQLVTYSYFDNNNSNQLIALFDAKDTLSKYTSAINCTNAGDITIPIIKNIRGNIASFECRSGDMGQIVSEMYELDLSTMTVQQIGREVTEPNL